MFLTFPNLHFLENNIFSKKWWAISWKKNIFFRKWPGLAVLYGIYTTAGRCLWSWSLLGYKFSFDIVAVYGLVDVVPHSLKRFPNDYSPVITIQLLHKRGWQLDVSRPNTITASQTYCQGRWQAIIMQKLENKGLFTLDSVWMRIKIAYTQCALNANWTHIDCVHTTKI